MDQNINLLLSLIIRVMFKGGFCFTHCGPLYRWGPAEQNSLAATHKSHSWISWLQTSSRVNSETRLSETFIGLYWIFNTRLVSHYMSEVRGTFCILSYLTAEETRLEIREGVIHHAPVTLSRAVQLHLKRLSAISCESWYKASSPPKEDSGYPIAKPLVSHLESSQQL